MDYVKPHLTVLPTAQQVFLDLVVTPLPLNHSKLTFGYLLETAHSRVAWLSDTAGPESPAASG